MRRRFSNIRRLVKKLMKLPKELNKTITKSLRTGASRKLAPSFLSLSNYCRTKQIVMNIGGVYPNTINSSVYKSMSCSQATLKLKFLTYVCDENQNYTSDEVSCFEFTTIFFKKEKNLWVAFQILLVEPSKA